MIKAIACVDAEMGIGKNGGLLLKIPSDLRRFKELTMGQRVLMGRKTLESLPGGKPLCGRENIVLSSQNLSGSDIICAHNIEEALRSLAGDGWVIGGESVYRAMLPYCDMVFLTEAEGSYGADRFFPSLRGFELASRSALMEEGGIRFRFCVYERRKR